MSSRINYRFRNAVKAKAVYFDGPSLPLAHLQQLVGAAERLGRTDVVVVMDAVSGEPLAPGAVVYANTSVTVKLRAPRSEILDGGVRMPRSSTLEPAGPLVPAVPAVRPAPAAAPSRPAIILGPMPSHLACVVCRALLCDALVLSCCGVVGCAGCVGARATCPSCGRRGVPAVVGAVRDAVAAFRTASGASGR